MNYCDWCIIKIISIINPSKGDVTLITTEYRFDHVNTYKICYVYNITRGGYCHCWELGFSPILAGKDSPNAVDLEFWAMIHLLIFIYA